MLMPFTRSIWQDPSPRFVSVKTDLKMTGLKLHGSSADLGLPTLGCPIPGPGPFCQPSLDLCRFQSRALSHVALSLER